MYQKREYILRYQEREGIRLDISQIAKNPLLKRPSLDSNDFKNYRPISNLRFISKTIEKCVAKQLIQYLDINDLGETYQSAYKRNHSTETALIRVHNDIAMAIDQHNSVILVLLDLLAAFDSGALAREARLRSTMGK